jgi:hypothetical protein
MSCVASLNVTSTPVMSSFRADVEREIETVATLDDAEPTRHGGPVGGP